MRSEAADSSSGTAHYVPTGMNLPGPPYSQALNIRSGTGEDL